MSGMYQVDEVLKLENRVDELECVIKKCLTENAHLADGEICTLIDLKRAVPEWEKEFLEQEEI